MARFKVIDSYGRAMNEELLPKVSAEVEDMARQLFYDPSKTREQNKAVAAGERSHHGRRHDLRPDEDWRADAVQPCWTPVVQRRGARPRGCTQVVVVLPTHNARLDTGVHEWRPRRHEPLPPFPRWRQPPHGARLTSTRPWSRYFSAGAGYVRR